MSMFGPKPGVWWLRSVEDPRWNQSGETPSLSCTSEMPPEAVEALGKLKEQLGDPPDDLEFGGMKD